MRVTKHVKWWNKFAIDPVILLFLIVGVECATYFSFLCECCSGVVCPGGRIGNKEIQVKLLPY